MYNAAIWMTKICDEWEECKRHYLLFYCCTRILIQREECKRHYFMVVRIYIIIQRIGGWGYAYEGKDVVIQMLRICSRGE